jgi:hypothetical protein
MGVPSACQYRPFQSIASGHRRSLTSRAGQAKRKDRLAWSRTSNLTVRADGCPLHHSSPEASAQSVKRRLKVPRGIRRRTPFNIHTATNLRLCASQSSP